MQITKYQLALRDCRKIYCNTYESIKTFFIKYIQFGIMFCSHICMILMSNLQTVIGTKGKVNKNLMLHLNRERKRISHLLVHGSLIFIKFILPRKIRPFGE